MKILHIVSFDVPYPPDYGGAYAVYHLLKTLQSNGIHVILHVFLYKNRRVTPELQDLCFRVYSYPRKTGMGSQLSPLPYIVNSRKDDQLLENLSGDNYPVLFEGIHTTYYLPELLNLKKAVYLRAHNNESAYYKQLASYEPGFKNRLYFNIESLRLKTYEPKIAKLAKTVFCFTQKDADFFQKLGAHTMVFNPYIADLEVEAKPGTGEFLLIHCNLSINDNVQSIIKILKKVAPNIEHKIIITGKNPDNLLKEAASHYKNVEIIPNPREQELIDLMQKAHIHLCYSDIAEGFKMRIGKIIKYGKYILCNESFCEDKTLQSLMTVENDLNKWPNIIKNTLSKPFTEDQIIKRTSILSNRPKTNNIKDFINVIFEKG